MTDNAVPLPLDRKPLLQSPPAADSPLLQDRLVGYASMLAGAVCWACLTLCVHIGAVHHGFPTASSVLLRSLVILSLSLPAFFLVEREPRAHLPSRENLILLSARSAAGALSCASVFASLERIPVGTVSTLMALSTVLTAVLCAVFLGEAATSVGAGAMLASFVGVALIARPPIPFLGIQGAEAVLPGSGSDYLAGVLFGCLAAFTFSVLSTLVRCMGTRVHLLVQAMAQGVGLGVIALLLISRDEFVGSFFHNRKGLVYNVVAALLGFCSLLFFTKVLQLCRGGAANVVRMTDVPLGYLLGFLFLGETVDAVMVVGAVLVVLAALVIAIDEMKKDVPRKVQRR